MAERLPIFLMVKAFNFFPWRMVSPGIEKTVTLSEWPIVKDDWNADGSGSLIPSLTPKGIPVILEVSKVEKASVVLECRESKRGFVRTTLDAFGPWGGVISCARFAYPIEARHKTITTLKNVEAENCS